jgi:hypothetical protein
MAVEVQGFDHPIVEVQSFDHPIVEVQSFDHPIVEVQGLGTISRRWWSRLEGAMALHPDAMAHGATAPHSAAMALCPSLVPLLPSLGIVPLWPYVPPCMVGCSPSMA